VKFLDQLPRLEIGQFRVPEYMPEIRDQLKGEFLLESEVGEHWETIEFSKTEFGPYSRAKLFFLCPVCHGRTQTLYLETSLKCRKCLKAQYLSNGWKQDEFYQNVGRPLRGLINLEAKLNRRYPKEKKEAWEREATDLAVKIQAQALAGVQKETDQFNQAAEDEYRRKREKQKFWQGVREGFITMYFTDPSKDWKKFESAAVSLKRKFRQARKFR
jgi:hypothetical protein